MSGGPNAAGQVTIGLDDVLVIAHSDKQTRLRPRRRPTAITRSWGSSTLLRRYDGHRQHHQHALKAPASACPLAVGTQKDGGRKSCLDRLP